MDIRDLVDTVLMSGHLVLDKAPWHQVIVTVLIHRGQTDLVRRALIDFNMSSDNYCQIGSKLDDYEIEVTEGLVEFLVQWNRVLDQMDERGRKGLLSVVMRLDIEGCSAEFLSRLKSVANI